MSYTLIVTGIALVVALGLVLYCERDTGDKESADEGVIIPRDRTLTDRLETVEGGEETVTPCNNCRAPSECLSRYAYPVCAGCCTCREHSEFEPSEYVVTPRDIQNDKYYTLDDVDLDRDE